MVCVSVSSLVLPVLSLLILCHRGVDLWKKKPFLSHPIGVMSGEKEKVMNCQSYKSTFQQTSSQKVVRPKDGMSRTADLFINHGHYVVPVRKYWEIVKQMFPK